MFIVSSVSVLFSLLEPVAQIIGVLAVCTLYAGKLQTLHTLLRRLKTGGHRVLIFTQMTRMLDVLEQFLNYHGHIYLRLDGSTRVEQRQVRPDRLLFLFGHNTSMQFSDVL